MSGQTQLIVVPYHEDPLTRLASHLLSNSNPDKFNLRNKIVLFSNSSAVSRFRKTLLDQANANGMDAIIPPFTGTLSYWIKSIIKSNAPALSRSATELLLLDALNDHPQLCARYGIWSLVDSLLALFEELELSQATLPATPEQLLKLLSEGYGINDTNLEPLTSEAKLAHTLWSAWRQQLLSHKVSDSAQWLAQGLRNSLDQLSSDTHIYYAGLVAPNAIERDWIKILLQQKQITLVLHGQVNPVHHNYHPDAPIHSLLSSLELSHENPNNKNALSGFLDQVYDWGTSSTLQDRAVKFASTTKQSPAKNRINIYRAPDTEHEARGVELQVRRWVLKGKRNIGIVTHDRKLARRVRALLERANITLNDTAGWAMSTTSAATALNRWLECAETRFHYIALLDLLKSPFFSKTQEEKKAVSTLEKTVILAGNIPSGIESYRKKILELVADRKMEGTLSQTLNKLLDRLAQSVQPLHTHINKAKPQGIKNHLKTLLKSLESIGLTETFAGDAAGEQLLANLEAMIQETVAATPVMDWHQFRYWLHRQLEQYTFRPQNISWQATLLSLQESRLFQFDAVIIAGASDEHLPGSIPSSPFFNDGVRQQLGLPLTTEKLAIKFYDFRRLLESAPKVLISVRQEQDGETVTTSPWVELLDAFHQLAYQDSLDDTELGILVDAAGTEIVSTDAPLPEAISSAESALPAPLIPARISASSWQQLLNCPYQFYAAQGLKLKPIDEVREDLEKQDYGQYVHRILQAFHSDVAGLPGPFTEPLTEINRQQAGQLLNDITDAVFADALSSNFLARGWLYRWQKIFPAWLDWAIKRAQTWQSYKSEIKTEQAYKIDKHEITLVGQLDQVDRAVNGDDGDELSIIDYKTGVVPKSDVVNAAENIQLPFYTLLMGSENPISQALFLQLDGEKVSDKVQLDGEDLKHLTQQLRDQLNEIGQSLYKGSPLPAHGDSETCGYCDMEGLCRRSQWS